MKYIVYLTTNLINNFIYVGVHKTEIIDKFDGYIGCGVYTNSPKSYNRRQTAFQCAVAKYGPENFYRKTLKVYDTLKEALQLEAEIVTQSFIERNDVYNQVVGGGYPPSSNKQIYQYDLEGNFIKEWESIKQITTYYNVNKDRVRMVIDNKRSFESSYWSEECFLKLDIKDYRPSSRGSIRQYTTTGIFVKLFKNTTEASKYLDIERSKITNAIHDKYSINDYWFLKEGETIESYLDGSIKEEPKVYMYSLEGTFIKKFENISEVRKSYKCNKNDLKRAIKNNSLFNDHYWSIIRYDNILLENPDIEQNTERKVYQYTMEGDLIKEWDSLLECRKCFPSVLQVCLGKKLHCKKFKFSFDKLKI